MSKKQRLDKVLAHLGYGSRAEIKSIVRKGVIRVNNHIVTDSGLQVDPEHDVIVFQDHVVYYREFVYLMLHKPAGVVSATEDTRDRTVVDLLHKSYQSFSVFPVGRLDKDTEGLLLLTNDGKLSHQLLSPRKHVPKTYFARIAWEVDESIIRLFSQGVKLDDGYVTMPAQLRILSHGDATNQQLAEIELTIFEGKFHQVKRMFQAVDRQVVYLKRISMGPLLLDANLALGEYRELTLIELATIKNYII
jgi:16S rRNA pseudouridine516 synthase